MYGQTEASTRISHMTLQTMIWKKGSVGRALNGINVKIHDTDKDGNGEICVQGENVTSGYYSQTSLTRKTIINGWLHTGDIGRIDNEGYIFVTGRKKNLIIYCGLNVYPEEVENILLQHPLVEDAIVFGKSDIDYGEKIFANVVLSNHPSNWKSILMEHCKNILTDYKVPYDIFDVDKIQRTNNGKVKRNYENKHS